MRKRFSFIMVIRKFVCASLNVSVTISNDKGCIMYIKGGLLVTRRGTLLMETGLLHDFLGIFPCEMKDIIFMWRKAHKVRLNPHEVRLKQTLEMEGGGGD